MKNDEKVTNTCIICGNGNEQLLRFELSTPSEKGPRLAWIHRQCFDEHRQDSVTPDDPEDHGRIPKNARCVFCGKKLPIFGHHAFCFDLGEKNPPDRYWTHAECLKKLWIRKND